MIDIRHILRVFIGFLLVANTAYGDGFAGFRAELQRKIPAGWKCSEIRTIEGMTVFDVKSDGNRYSIVITKREFISQEEWTIRSERMGKVVQAIAAGKEANITDANVLVEATGLPDGRYGKVAVSVGLSEPDIWYSDIEADDRESKMDLKTIHGTLELYKKSEQAAPRNR